MASTGQDIETAKQALEAGQLVGIPTETVYGLAANAFDPIAVTAIFSAKNRPSFDPLIVHAGHIDQVRELVLAFPEKAKLLAETFWPGPLTLLLPKKERIPDIVTAGMSEAAFRIPDNPLTLSLLSSLAFPLVAPSANPFGYISPTTAAHVNDQLGDKVAYILDGGPCRIGLESTIIGFPESGPEVYRAGGLTREEIESVIGPVRMRSHSSSNPKAPGMLKSHYAPRTRVVLSDPDKLSADYQNQNIALLAFGPADKLPVPEGAVIRNLSPHGDLSEAARNLFGFLRELDALSPDLILAMPVPSYGLGRAINDRLKRAAAE